MGLGADADPLAGGHEGDDDAGPGPGLAGARGALYWEGGVLQAQHDSPRRISQTLGRANQGQAKSVAG